MKPKLLCPVFLFFSLFFAGNSVSFAQSSLKSWWQVSGEYSFYKKWNVQASADYRALKFAKNFNQFNFRVGLGYDYKPKVQFALYYQVVTANDSIDQTIKNYSSVENRISQQVLFKNEYRTYKLKNRIRIDERFSKGEFNFRIRYMIEFIYPLFTKKYDATPWNFIAYNEIFLSPVGRIYEKDRLYAGLKYLIRPHVNTQIGMLWQLYNKQTEPIVNLSLNFSY